MIILTDVYIISGWNELRAQRRSGQRTGDAYGDLGWASKVRTLLQPVCEFHGNHRFDSRARRIFQGRVRQQGNREKLLVRGHETSSTQSAEFATLRGQSKAQSDFWSEHRQEKGHQRNIQHQSESDWAIVSMTTFYYDNRYCCTVVHRNGY